MAALVTAVSLVAALAALVLTCLIALVLTCLVAVSALRSELTGTIGLACGEVASAGTVGDVSDRSARRESCAECEDSAGNPARGD